MTMSLLAFIVKIVIHIIIIIMLLYTIIYDHTIKLTLQFEELADSRVIHPNLSEIFDRLEGSILTVADCDDA